MAELLYEKNRLDEVRQLLALHYPQARELGFVDNLIAGFVTAARLAFHDGQVDQAMAILDEAQHFAGRFQFERLNAHALCERVRQCLALGDLSAAVALLPGCRSNEWIQKYALGQNATTTQELMAIAHARVWGDLGHQAEALAVLRHWLVHAKQRNVVRSSVRISVLLCRLSAQQGHAAAARRYLIDALEFGAAAGFVRSFVDEGPIVLEQLAALHAAPTALTPTQLAVVNGILAVANCGSNGGPGSGKFLEVTAREVGDSDPGLGTSLSHREMKILQLAADSLANSEVGAALGLTESTVKSYWQRIFTKFGVHRRSSVIQRARSLGLLKSDRP
jgi:LuxR family maltose regulon positive regulatory protein